MRERRGDGFVISAPSIMTFGDFPPIPADPLSLTVRRGRRLGDFDAGAGLNRVNEIISIARCSLIAGRPTSGRVVIQVEDVPSGHTGFVRIPRKITLTTP